MEFGPVAITVTFCITAGVTLSSACVLAALARQALRRRISFGNRGDSPCSKRQPSPPFGPPIATTSSTRTSEELKKESINSAAPVPVFRIVTKERLAALFSTRALLAGASITGFPGLVRSAVTFVPTRSISGSARSWASRSVDP
jgi:hypothetical protein